MAGSGGVWGSDYWNTTDTQTHTHTQETHRAPHFISHLEIKEKVKDYVWKLSLSLWRGGGDRNERGLEAGGEG